MHLLWHHTLKELLHAFANEFGCDQDKVVLYLRSKPVDEFGTKVEMSAAVQSELGQACPCIRMLPRMDGLNMYVQPFLLIVCSENLHRNGLVGGWDGVKTSFIFT